jgi:hypothetical protein
MYNCIYPNIFFLLPPELVSFAGILEQSMGAGNRVEIELSCLPARLHWPAESIPWNWFLETVFLNFCGAQESIPPAYVANLADRYDNLHRLFKNSCIGLLKRLKLPSLIAFLAMSSQLEQGLYNRGQKGAKYAGKCKAAGL